MTMRWRSIALAALGLVLLFAGPVVGWRAGHLTEASRLLPQTAAFLLAGALATLAQPRHRGARRLLGVGLIMAVGGLAGSAYCAYLLERGVPGWAPLAVLGLNLLDLAQAMAILALLAVFPDGVYHRPSERVVVLGAGVYVALALAALRYGSARISYRGTLIWGDIVEAPNQGASPALSWLGAAGASMAQAGFALFLVLGVVLLALRYRRLLPEDQLRARWLLGGATVTVALATILGLLAPWVSSLPPVEIYLLYAPVALAVPAAIGVAMVRHRFLNVDEVIRRSMVYAVLWVLITSVYVAIALALGLTAGGTLPLPLVLLVTVVATLIVAPVRRWLDAVADRLVFGRRLSGYELIAGLGNRLEQTATSSSIGAIIAAEVRDGLGLQWARVLFDDAPGQAIGSAGRIPEPALPALCVPLDLGGVTVGAIECGPRRRGPFTESDREVLVTLGRQVALAVHNSRLTDELAERVAELASSRARLVHAEDASRRRLERDLHDGVQQELVALLARLGLARNQIHRDPLLAERTLAEGLRDAQHALLGLQEVSRGIHPTLLSDQGIAAAVSERASRMPIPVSVENGLCPGHRLPAEVEGAAYFLVSEALTNVLKHACAQRVHVGIGEGVGSLRITVQDDGTGFDVGCVSRRGLLGLQDRIEALGGRLQVLSQPGHGTTLVATMPTGRADGAEANQEALHG